jgi:hypothetical protein
MLPNTLYATLATAAIPTATLVFEFPVNPGTALVVILAVLAASSAALWLATRPRSRATRRTTRRMRPRTVVPLPNQA